MSQQNNTILGFGYQAQVGKDTAADYLIDKYGFKRISWATPIKEGIGRVIFGFNNRQLYGDLKDKVDDYWNEELDIYDVTNICETCGESHREVTPMPPMDDTVICNNCTSSMKEVGVRLDVTPRLVFQLAGTQGGRHIFGENLWVAATKRYIYSQPNNRWVIPDVRFPNEADAIQATGGYVYRIDRDQKLRNKIESVASEHESEWAMAEFNNWNDHIDNNNSFDALYRQIEDKVVSKVLVKRFL